jgi:hypothetical protein
MRENLLSLSGLSASFFERFLCFACEMSLNGMCRDFRVFHESCGALPSRSAGWLLVALFCATARAQAPDLASLQAGFKDPPPTAAS